ncbi:unnamed protein product [Ilex paraguariensis]|uniref:GH18 domain-containing protein n=1 Tax=Ilex paraguariensis TaxID=185542 RepID=A0ABC8QV31_9AQUA
MAMARQRFLLLFLATIVIASATSSVNSASADCSPPPSYSPKASPPLPWALTSPPAISKASQASPVAAPASPMPWLWPLQPTPEISYTITPSSSPTPPSPAPFAPTSAPAPPSRGIKGAYWPSGQAGTLPPSMIPTSYFTHIFYAFVLLDSTSYQVSITQTDHWVMLNFTSTLHAKKPPAKAILSIGGASASADTFSSMVSNLDNRAAFIKSTIDVARKYGFDGLDLDWEFPNTPQDMSNLLVLFEEWRSAVNMESIVSGKAQILLSAAVYFSSNISLLGVPRTYPGDAIRNYADFVNPMCYDYHGAWNTSVTGAHALLYDKSSNLSTSYGISTWKNNGVPSNKLVMGMPMYGRTWELKDPNHHGIGDPAVGIGPGNLGVMTYSEIVDFNLGHNATEVFDEETVSTYSYGGKNWTGYDDTRSITDKVKFAKAQGLGGYFFWALGFDKNWTLSRAD